MVPCTFCVQVWYLKFVFFFSTTNKKSSFNLNVISLAGTVLLMAVINTEEKKDREGDELYCFKVPL